MHGRLHTERHSTALSEIPGSDPRRSASASKRPGPNGSASVLQVTQTSRVAAAEGPLWAFMTRQSESASNPLGVKSGVGRVVMNAPWPPLRRPCGIHRRTAGLLARGVSPTPPSRTHKKSSGEKASARRSQSRGRPRIGGKAYRVPFSPSGAIEGPCLEFMSQLREGLSNGARNALGPCKARKPPHALFNARIRAKLQTSKEDPPALGLEDLRTVSGALPAVRTPSCSSHNAVILASATTGFRGRSEFSASAERRSAPNSVSANRRSISCCNRASAS